MTFEEPEGAVKTGPARTANLPDSRSKLSNRRSSSSCDRRLQGGVYVKISYEDIEQAISDVQPGDGVARRGGPASTASPFKSRTRCSALEDSGESPI